MGEPSAASARGLGGVEDQYNLGLGTVHDLFDHGVLRLIMSSDASAVTLPKHAGIAGAVVATGEVQHVPDAYADPRFDRSVRGFDEPPHSLD